MHNCFTEFEELCYMKDYWQVNIIFKYINSYLELEENDSEASSDANLEDRVERAKILLAQKRAAQAEEKAQVSDAFSFNLYHRYVMIIGPNSQVSYVSLSSSIPVQHFFWNIIYSIYPFC